MTTPHNLVKRRASVAKLSSSGRQSGNFRLWASFKSSSQRGAETAEIDAEALTSQERLSRLLHNPKPQVHLKDEGPIFEHFVVVGAQTPDNPQPKILYHYPPEKEIVLPGIEDFCFPNGVDTRPSEESLVKGDLVRYSHDQSYLSKPENSYVFLFTDEQATVYYGVCVRVTQIFEDTPLYMRPFDELGNFWQTQRCFCLITKFPFFRMHLEIIYDLFALDHIERLQHTPPGILDPADELRPKSAHDRLISTQSAPSHVFTGPATPLDKRKKNSLSDGRADLLRTEPAALARSSSRQQLESSDPRLLLAVVEFGRSDRHSSAPVESDSAFLGAATPTDEMVPVPERRMLSLEALAKYRDMEIPRKGIGMRFRPFGDLLPELSFKRPFFDEEEELFAEWGLALTFFLLNRKTLFFMLSCMLLERKIALISSNLRVLSSIVLSFTPLIRPFVYQSVIIPVLPEKMYSFLEAPVPFVVGLTKFPPPEETPKDIILIDVDKSTWQANEHVPPIPRISELKKKTDALFQKLQKIYTDPPFNPTKECMNDVTSILRDFDMHLSALFADFKVYTIRDMSDPANRISVFMKESFIADQPAKDAEFFKPFVETQIFLAYSDRRLRRMDEKHSERYNKKASSIGAQLTMSLK